MEWVPSAAACAKQMTAFELDGTLLLLNLGSLFFYLIHPLRTQGCSIFFTYSEFPPNAPKVCPIKVLQWTDRFCIWLSPSWTACWFFGNRPKSISKIPVHTPCCIVLWKLESTCLSVPRLCLYCFDERWGTFDVARQIMMLAPARASVRINTREWSCHSPTQYLLYSSLV